MRIEFEFENLDQVQKALDVTAYSRAMRRGARRTLPTAKRIVRNKTAKTYNVRPGKINKITTTKISSIGDKVKTLVKYKDRRLNLINFVVGRGKLVDVGPTPWGRKRRQQFVKIKNNGSPKKLIKGGFAGVGKNANRLIFKREGKARHPIRALKTISIPEMIEYGGAIDTLKKDVPGKFRKELNAALQHELNQAFRKMVLKRVAA